MGKLSADVLTDVFGTLIYVVFCVLFIKLALGFYSCGVFFIADINIVCAVFTGLIGIALGYATFLSYKKENQENG